MESWKSKLALAINTAGEILNILGMLTFVLSVIAIFAWGEGWATFFLIITFIFYLLGNFCLRVTRVTPKDKSR